jgi:hypothetical protein
MTALLTIVSVLSVGLLGWKLYQSFGAVKPLAAPVVNRK